ncbi:MAG: mevalonate kinase [Cardiobacteriaceae bacterium]|nr:mevalonate kinase [Cardiobacteriaceae bacterium]
MTEIIAKAPGSLMICGEHAVVYDYWAIVCAISEYITVNLQTRSDNNLVIYSSLGDYKAPLDNLKDNYALRFILAAVKKYPPTQGITLKITSSINPEIGFASSAAVTVATLAALIKLNQLEVSDYDLHQVAHNIILEIQGRASGADLAASIFGGMLAYRRANSAKNKHMMVEKLPLPSCNLSVRYAGYKTPTAQILEDLAQKYEQNQLFYNKLHLKMGDKTLQAIAAAKEEQWEAFFNFLQDYHKFMCQLGVCDFNQSIHIRDAINNNGKGVKISGSGLGDCIIAFYDEILPENHMQVLPTTTGVQVEVVS